MEHTEYEHYDSKEGSYDDDDMQAQYLSGWTDGKEACQYRIDLLVFLVGLTLGLCSILFF